MKPTILLNAARVAEKTGRTSLALSLYKRSTGGTAEQRAQALYRIANLEYQDSTPKDAQRLLEEAVELQPDQAAWQYRLGTLLEKQGLNDEALTRFQAAVALQPDNADWVKRMERTANTLRMAKAKNDDERAKSLRKQGARWQELEVLLSSASNFTNSPDWHLRLGDSLEAMNRFGEAAEAFARANSLRPHRSENLAREAYCWLKSGENERAKSVFDLALQHDNELGSRLLGIGVFFERRGMWHESAHYFEKHAEVNPTSAELQFRAGRSLERSYRWKEAASRYRQAAMLSLKDARFHLRLGFVRERMSDYAGAEESYSYAIGLRSKTPPAKYWSYRLGVVRENQGKVNEALEAYTNSLDIPLPFMQSCPYEEQCSENQQIGYELELLGSAMRLALRSGDVKHILSVAGDFEDRGMWTEVVRCLEAAADRSQNFDASIYFRLGIAYSRLHDSEAAVRSFRMTRIEVPPRGIDGARYKKDASLQRNFEYTEMLENLPLRDNVIFYESFLGNQVTCNPYALFRSIIQDTTYANFIHVWSVTSSTHIPTWMREKENVIFVQRGSHQNRRFLATAKYLVNNVTFPDYFIRRAGQKYLNTWHGTPMKTLGKDVGTGILEHRNVARNFLQATHIVTPNEHTTQVILERYDIDTLVTAKVAYTGYPRVDLTVNTDAERRSALLGQLGIKKDDNRQIVLYAPTWRGGADFKHFDTDRLASDLEKLAQLDCIVLFQGHHLSAQLLPKDLPVHIVSHEVNTNELLSVVSVLITDYSSILFDFIPMKRPIICYTYDLNDYVAERGLYFTPTDLGIASADTTESLVGLVRASLGDPHENTPSTELTDSFCAREDGKATERVKSFLFNDASKWDVVRQNSGKRRFLFHHSMIPNGISTSLLNLLRSLDPSTCDITLVVPVSVLRETPGSVEVLKSLPAHVKVVGDAGRQVVNIEEKWLIDYFNRWHVLPSKTQMDQYVAAFEREYRRLFGETEFDSIVEFEGYSRYWTSVLAAAQGDGKKVIHLHSDMEAERLVRFPYLRCVFDLYDRFDVLASVSPALSEVNRDRLAPMAGILPGKFVSIMNQIDPDGVRQKAKEPLDEDLIAWFSSTLPTFVTVGRLSVEKDQAKLLHAIGKAFSEGYRANLVILGDGPLRADLEELTEQLGLQDNVLFAGQRKNPFPALLAAKCFILSSNHEGQPMVLLESMILGTPILATDIPGSRNVLAENLSSIVENSVEGLASGIIRVLEGHQTAPMKFDSNSYWQATRDAFLAISR